MDELDTLYGNFIVLIVVVVNGLAGRGQLVNSLLTVSQPDLKPDGPHPGDHKLS